MSSMVHRNPAEHIWESHRKVLEGRYVKDGWPLHKVMAYMEETHGFIAKKNQYEKYLNHKWKLRKYTDSSKWKAASSVIRSLQQAGEPFELWIDGDKKSDLTIRKELKRYAASSHIHQLSSTENPIGTLGRSHRDIIGEIQGLPRGVIVRKLAASTAPNSIAELPFFRFEIYAAMYLPNISSDIRSDRSNRIFKDDFGNLALRGLDRSVPQALKAVMPVQGPSESYLGSFAINPSNALQTSPIYREILFSLTNNFAGISALPEEEFFVYLQRNASQDLYQMVRSTPEFYTTQAIARSLFQSSVRAGNAQFVDFLLKQYIPGIHVGSAIFPHYGSYRTPIEEADSLMHTEVVEVLLAHGAKLGTHKSIHNFDALSSLFRGLAVGNDRIDPDMKQDLEAVMTNGEMNDEALEEVIRRDRDGIFVPLIFSVHMSENHERWSKAGIFLNVFRWQDQSWPRILELMLIHNVDLNYQVSSKGRNTTLIDEVARWGNLDQVEKLLECGAILTADTLPNAIRSGNEDLVNFLLDYAARSGRQEHLVQSALATATFRQDSKMMDLICQRGLGFLKDREDLQVVVKSSSMMADISWIKYLVEIGGVLNSKDLGYGLGKAVHEGRDEAALALIDAGADINCYARYGGPLAQALRRGNALVALALLDAGADPNFPLKGRHSKTSLELAVKSGDPNIVRAIIEAGVYLNTNKNADRQCLALNPAIKMKNKDIATMLLHAGYDINHRNSLTDGDDSTALAAAAGTGDLDWVRFVMDWGADPHDPVALLLAWNKNRAAFDLILDQHRLKYSKGRRAWGVAILKKAIDHDDYKSFTYVLERGADANWPFKNLRGDPGIFFQATTVFGYAIEKWKSTGFKFIDFILQQQQTSGCNPETVVYCVEADADYGVMRTRFTAFLGAIGTGDLPLVELFLRHNADVNYPARAGVRRTPLQRASEFGNIDLVVLLLERGADPNGPAAHEAGGTALQLASIGGYLRIVQLLLDNGANVNAPASKLHGRTPLEGAAEHGRLDMVAFLLKAGAGQNGKDKKDFDKAIARAEENGFPYIADLLRQYLKTGEVAASTSLPSEFINFEMVE